VIVTIREDGYIFDLNEDDCIKLAREMEALPLKHQRGLISVICGSVVVNCKNRFDHEH
jgi:hypothetical protein